MFPFLLHIYQKCEEDNDYEDDVGPPELLEWPTHILQLNEMNLSINDKIDVDDDSDEDEDDDEGPPDLVSCIDYYSSDEDDIECENHRFISFACINSSNKTTSLMILSSYSFLQSFYIYIMKVVGCIGCGG